jgi:DNA-binding transcriptional LysR family regulator
VNLRQLEVFRTAIEAGSATEAARALGISQPAISRHLALFESGLGLTLFRLDRGRLEPTPEGLRLYDEVEQAFSGVERVLRMAQDIRDLGTGEIRSAVVPSLADGFCRRALGQFMQRFPRLTVSLEARSNRLVAEKVASQLVDIGIGTLPIVHTAVETRNLVRPRAVCVLHKQHPLASKETIRAQDLDGVPYVALASEHRSRIRLDEIFRDAGATPNNRVEVATTESACALAAEGIGMTVVNAITAGYFTDSDVVIRPFEPELRYDFGLLFCAHRQSSRIVMALVETLRDYAASLELE